MALSIEQIELKVKSLERLASQRDERASKVLLVRQGRIQEIAPDFYPEGIDGAVVANFVDIVARDLSEVMAPLPAINCSAVNQATAKARSFADNRTRIGSNYLLNSEMSAHMYVFADRYLTYGFGVFVVELDKAGGIPRIRVEDSYRAYPEFDRYDRCVSFTKSYSVTLGELLSQYPEHAANLRDTSRNSEESLDSLVTLYRYYDKDQSTIFIPSKENYVISRVKNPIGKMMVIVAKRPSVDGQMRGQFDDVLGIQVLRNRFAILAVEAAEKAIQAPLVVPFDVQDFQLGPDSIIRTNQPQGVRKVDIQVPAAAFAESSLLGQEMQTGARYPQGRTGNVNASVITGQGVQALMGAFDTQVKSFQTIASNAIRKLIEVCFQVDEKVYDKKKTIRGVDSGAPFSIEYTPSKDINGDYSVDVNYGMLAGLNPAQALVFMLQAAQAGWVSDDKAMRELPFNVNVTTEQEKIEVEKIRKSLLGAVEQLAQSIPQMIAGGVDPSSLISKLAQIATARQKGTQIEEAMETIFAPPAPEPENAGENTQEGGVEEPPQGGILPQQNTPAPPPEGVQTMLSRIAQNGQAGTSVSTSSQRK